MAAIAAVVRRSCQTIAFGAVFGDAGSHATTVSRWFVSPSARIDAGATPAAAIASRPAAIVRSKSSAGSGSTQPGSG